MNISLAVLFAMCFFCFLLSLLSFSKLLNFGNVVGIFVVSFYSVTHLKQFVNH